MGTPNLDVNATPMFLVGGDVTDVATFGKPVGSLTAPLQTVPTQPALTAGTDRSGTTSATAGTATTLAPANAARRGLNIQNISASNIGINEVGAAASIGTAGTYTVPAGSTVSIRTNRAISVVGSAASLAYTATEF
jgi:hypothetical protein